LRTQKFHEHFHFNKKRLHERQITIRSGEYQFFNQLDGTVLIFLEVRVRKSCNINVGDRFWGGLMLVTPLRCWLSIWDVGGRFFTLKYSVVTNMIIPPPISLNCQYHKVTNITVAKKILLLDKTGPRIETGLKILFRVFFNFRNLL